MKRRRCFIFFPWRLELGVKLAALLEKDVRNIEPEGITVREKQVTG